MMLGILIRNPIKGSFGAQLSFTPVQGISAYLNFMDGSVSGTIVDLTASFQLSEKFKLGLNAADFQMMVKQAILV
jgi:hypothetical protein